MQEEGNLALGTLAPSAGKTNSVVVSRGFEARSSAAGMLLPRVFGLRKPRDGGGCAAEHTRIFVSWRTCHLYVILYVLLHTERITWMNR